MNFPDNIKYTREHEWIRLAGETAYVGISDFAQEELGEIVYVDITSQGESLGQGETFGTIEAVKTVSDLFMPVGGTVEEVNPALEDQPELVNQDPYGEGWLIKITVSDTQEIEQLLSADQYKALIGK